MCQVADSRIISHAENSSETSLRAREVYGVENGGSYRLSDICIAMMEVGMRTSIARAKNLATITQLCKSNCLACKRMYTPDVRAQKCGVTVATDSESMHSGIMHSQSVCTRVLGQEMVMFVWCFDDVRATG